jgi:hypothetical protein
VQDRASKVLAVIRRPSVPNRGRAEQGMSGGSTSAQRPIVLHRRTALLSPRSLPSHTSPSSLMAHAHALFVLVSPLTCRADRHTEILSHSSCITDQPPPKRGHPESAPHSRPSWVCQQLWGCTSDPHAPNRRCVPRQRDHPVLQLGRDGSANALRPLHPRRLRVTVQLGRHPSGSFDGCAHPKEPVLLPPASGLSWAGGSGCIHCPGVRDRSARADVRSLIVSGSEPRCCPGVGALLGRGAGEPAAGYN